MIDTRSAAWREFDRRVYYGLLADWLVLAACALLVLLTVGQTQLALHAI